MRTGERMERCSKAIGIVGMLALLCLITGCNPTKPVDFNTIDTPSAVRDLVWRDLGHSDNLAHYQLGAIKHSGEIFEITEFEAMWSYEFFTQGSEPDLAGIAFSLEMDNQWGYGLLGDKFADGLGHFYVLEFTFPEAAGASGTEINWFVTPHLICSYEILSQPGDLVPSHEAPVDIPEELWFEYVILEDPLAAYDLMMTAPNVMIGALESAIENEQEFIFDAAANETLTGTVTAFNDDRSGTMNVLPGTRAKLFVGVSVYLNWQVQGDRIQIGGDRLPDSVATSDRCTFDFGTDSYYTMQAIGD